MLTDASSKKDEQNKKTLIIAIAAGCGAVAFTVLFIILWCMCCPHKGKNSSLSDLFACVYI